MNFKNDTRAVGWQIIMVFFGLFVVSFAYIILGPMFSELSLIATESIEGSFFADDSESFLNILDVVADPGILIIFVIMTIVSLISTAILLTNNAR